MQQTKPKQPTALTPADPLGARFCQYFNHPWKHIYAPVPQSGEKPQWRASKYCLSTRSLWQRYLDPDTLIGLRFGDETRYCLLDIDKGSPNHPANNFSGFKDVLNALEEIGLVRPLVFTSSSSGGLHVYYFFDRPLPTFALACAIKFALEDASFRLRSGCLESFPNTKSWNSYYNACRLPLQTGSFLLDDDLQPLTSDLAHFLDAADVAAASQDLPTLQACCSVASERYEPRRMSDKLKGDVAEWERDWAKTIAEGWTAPGQTNELLKVMVAYGTVFKHLSGEDLIDYVVNTAINATGYQEFCGHQHEIRLRAQAWASSTEKNGFYSPYCSYPKRLATYKETFGSANNVVPFKSQINSQRSAEAQDRVRQAVAHLKALGTLPRTVGERALALISTAKEILGIGVSRVTLWKHLELWHPKHYKNAAVLQKQPAPCNDCSENPTPPSCSTETDVETKTPEPALVEDSSEKSYTPPLMKVISDLSGMAPFGGVPCPAPDLEEGGESEGGDEPVAAAESAPAAEPAINTADLRRITALRLQAVKYAQQLVRNQSFDLGRLIRGTERANAEQIAKFRFYWESGEPALMAEASSWAISNPDALPEALPPDAASPKNAELPPFSAASSPPFSAASSPKNAELPPFSAASSPPADDLTTAIAQELAATASSDHSQITVGASVAHIDPYVVAYAYHGTVESVTEDSAVVRWVERYGKPLERETYEQSSLRLLEESEPELGKS